MANQRTLAVKVNINEMVGNEKPNKEIKIILEDSLYFP